ncbi:MAG: D-alanine--D-alanine ligase, partial [Rhodospirillales bacterium]|nr:D-alanine--D-alanine ligase [Rhodospirillales bacterium]
MTVTPLNILLLKGGPSAEREVSLMTGAACTQALRSLGHRVAEYELTCDLDALCKALTPKPDVVFNSLHG